MGRHSTSHVCGRVHAVRRDRGREGRARYGHAAVESGALIPPPRLLRAVDVCNEDVEAAPDNGRRVVDAENEGCVSRHKHRARRQGLPVQPPLRGGERTFDVHFNSAATPTCRQDGVLAVKGHIVRKKPLAAVGTRRIRPRDFIVVWEVSDEPLGVVVCKLHITMDIAVKLVLMLWRQRCGPLYPFCKRPPDHWLASKYDGYSGEASFDVAVHTRTWASGGF